MCYIISNDILSANGFIKVKVGLMCLENGIFWASR